MATTAVRTSNAKTLPGTSYPLAAMYDSSGTNFAVFSEIAERIDLGLFDEDGRETRITMSERDGYNWHVYLTGIGPGQQYGYRVHGPWEPKKGLRCCPNKLLLDPNCKAVSGAIHWSDVLFPYRRGKSESRCSASNDAHLMMKSAVTTPYFDWSQGYIKVMRIFLNGDLGYVDRRGEPVRDDDFLVLINAHHEDIFFQLALADPERPWQIVLNTSTRIEDSQEGEMPAEDSRVKSEGRSVIALTRPCTSCGGTRPLGT
jgi:pullulanase/glycogen debranching enzyme